MIGAEVEDIVSADPFAPSQAWMDAFTEQCTEELTARLAQFARTRAVNVENAGRKIDDYYAKELVADAIADTYMGVIRWDPAVCALSTHICQTVIYRTRNDIEHQRSNPHDAIGDDTDQSRSAEARAAEEAPTVRQIEARRYATEVMAQIRLLARDDRDVLRIVAAYDEGMTRKSEVMEHARMRERTYHNARIRLGRIVKSLSRRSNQAVA